MKNISQTTCHYVRCICSNYKQAPQNFDSPIVLHQLTCSGIIDCVKIRMLGYPIRRNHHEFIQRYTCLMPKNLDTNNVTLVIEQFLQPFQPPDSRKYFQMGKTKVFLNDKLNRFDFSFQLFNFIFLSFSFLIFST